MQTAHRAPGSLRFRGQARRSRWWLPLVVVAAVLALPALAHAQLVITEIMYDPDSPEPDWEWVEVFNTDPVNTVDLSTGWVLADPDLDTGVANITSGSVPPASTAVLFNSGTGLGTFQAAWPNATNAIPVNPWPQLGNAGGDRITIWASYSDYNNDDDANPALDEDSVDYDVVGPWPVPDGAASIARRSTIASSSSGANWRLSAVGDRGGVNSIAGGGNTGADIGSPGTVHFVVTSDADDMTPGTLRQVLTGGDLDANAAMYVDPSILPATIVLNPVLGTIQLATGYTIVGPGRDMLTIDGDDATGIFRFTNGTSIVSDLTLTQGAPGATAGGAIGFTAGTLTLTRVTITDSNSATAPGGGGIFCGGNLTMTDVTIDNCTTNISGGAIFNQGSITAFRCTFSNCLSGAGGGGIDNAGDCDLTNCTISGNTTTAGQGGGLLQEGGGSTTTMVHVTIVDNTSPNTGGGARRQAGGAFTMTNCLVGNNSGAAAGPDLSGNFVSGGGNVLGILGNATGFDDMGVPPDRYGDTDTPLDVGVDLLRDNGGETMTHSLLPHSPAIDFGTDADIGIDQRGIDREDGGGDPLYDGDCDGMADIDAGAFEARVIEVTSFQNAGAGTLRQAILDANGDAGHDFICITTISGTINLTAVLPTITDSITIQGPDDETVEVDAAAGTRLFDVAANASLVIGNLELSGDTLASGNGAGVRLAGGGSSGVYLIDVLLQDCVASAGQGAGIWSDGTVTLIDSRIESADSGDLGGGIYIGANGSGELVRSTIDLAAASNGGGCIYCESDLVLTDSTLTNAQNTADGAGLYLTGDASLQMTNSTISGCDTANSGGGGGMYIDLSAGAAVISNSTISGNTCDDGGGGGIHIANGLVQLDHVTIANNNAGDGTGGGIRNVAGTCEVGNSIIGTNSAGGGSPDVNGNFTSNDGNVVQNNGGGAGFGGGDIIGFDPLLAPLADNGGETETHGPMNGSPVLGFATDGETVDQRGATRDGGGNNDAGSLETRAPVVTVVMANQWLENSGALSLDPTADITDADATELGIDLASATVTIGAGYQEDEDILLLGDPVPGIVANFDGPSGTLTLTGPAPLADFITALQAVDYDNAGAGGSDVDNPTPGDRTITFTVNDGSREGSDDLTLTVTPVNDPPTVTCTGGSVTWNDTGAIQIDPGVTVSGNDSTDYNGGSLTVSYDVGGTGFDQLTIVDGGSITVTGSQVNFMGMGIGDIDAINDGVDGAPLQVNFDTVDANDASVTALMQRFFYDNTSPNPSPNTRVVRFEVDDGDGAANGGDPTGFDTRDVDVVTVNDQPTLDLADPSIEYTEAIPLNVDDAAVVTDPDSPDFAGGSLLIEVTVNGTGNDQLLVENQGTGAGQISIAGSTVSYEGNAIGTVNATLDGVDGQDLQIDFTTSFATPAAAQALAQAIQYDNSSTDPSDLDRTIQFTIDDGDGGTSTDSDSRVVTITKVNSAPVVDTTDTPLTYNEGDGPVTLDGAVTVTDLDSSIADAAEIEIAANYVDGEDVLVWTGTNPDINANFDTGSGVLTFTLNAGVVDFAEIQAAFREVTYENTSTAPSELPRTVRFRVTDDLGAQTADTPDNRRTINVIGDASPPVLNNPGGDLGYEENTDSAGVPLAPTMTVTDADSTTLQSATLTFTAGYIDGEDLLEYTTQSGITGNFDSGTGTMTLSGSATLSQWQGAIRAVRYRNTNDRPDETTRTVQVIANDGVADSNMVDVDILITAENDAPVNTVPLGLQTLDKDTPLLFDSGTASEISVADGDADNLTVALIATSGTVTLGDIGGITITSGSNGSATVTFNGTIAAVNASLDGLTYTPTTGFTGTGSVQINTNDGGESGTGGTLSDIDTVLIDVRTPNDADIAILRNTIPLTPGGNDTLTLAIPVGAPTVVVYQINSTGTDSLVLDGDPLVAITGTTNATAMVTTEPAGTVASGTSTAFAIQIDPDTAGAVDVSISIGNNVGGKDPFTFTILATAALQPEIGVTRDAVPFANGGEDDLGSPLAGGVLTLTYTVGNTGGGTLTVSEVELRNLSNCAATLVAVPTTIAASSSDVVTIDVVPASSGVFRCDVVITSDDADEPEFAVRITGSATVSAVPSIALERLPGVPLPANGSVDLGLVPDTGSTDFSLDVVNTGSATLTLTNVIVSGSTVVSVQNAPVQVEPAERESVDLRVTPSAAGSIAFTLTITSNDPDVPTYQVTGTVEATAASTPALLVYRQGIAGARSHNTNDNIGGVEPGVEQALVYTIVSAGTADLVITPPVMLSQLDNATAWIAGQPSDTTLSPGEQARVIVRFTPINGGQVRFRLQITSDSVATPTFTLFVRSTGQTPQIEVRRGFVPLANGEVEDIGLHSARGDEIPLTWVIANTGSGELTITEISVNNVTGVAVTTGLATPVVIGPGETRDLQAIAAPNAAGTFSFTINVDSNSSFDSTFAIGVTGTAEFEDNGPDAAMRAPLASVALVLLIALLWRRRVASAG